MKSLFDYLSASFRTRPAAWFCVLGLPFLLAAAAALVADFLAALEPVSVGVYAAGSPSAATLFTFAQMHVVVVGLLAELNVRKRDPVSRRGSGPP
jgi:hypothetical protein